MPNPMSQFLSALRGLEEVKTPLSVETHRHDRARTSRLECNHRPYASRPETQRTDTGIGFVGLRPERAGDRRDGIRSGKKPCAA
jgi:hypothetical protein